MAGGGTVLLLTQWYDPTADTVVKELNSRGVPVFRCDPAEFPQRMRLAGRLDGGWRGRLALPERELALEDVGCAYYRRPSRFELPEGLSEAERDWAAGEARAGLGGVLSCLPRWLNHPAAIVRAEYKAWQLAVAAEVGLDVPRTIITNDQETAVAFAREVGEVVYKPLHSGYVPAEGGGQSGLIYTTPVGVAELADPGIAMTAHLFQERLAKDHEIRLTVVDDLMFAARIDAGSPSASQDWRSDYGSLGYSVTKIPDRVAGAVIALMRRLDLRFGAIDLIVTPDGRHVFVEINPNGQWAWIEDRTGLPIAAAIADALTAR